MNSIENLPDENVKCLTCAKNLTVKTERTWTGPSCTEFVQDLSSTDKCVIVGGSFFSYCDEKLVWERKDIMGNSYSGSSVNKPGASMLVFCFECLDTQREKQSLLVKEKERLTKLVNSVMLIIISEQEQIKELHNKIAKNRHELSRLEDRLSSF